MSHFEERWWDREKLAFIISSLRLDGISMSIAAQMVYGYSRKESAESLGVSEACIRGRRYRIHKQMKRLRRIWDKG